MVVVLQGTIIPELHPQQLQRLHRGWVLINIRMEGLPRCLMEVEELKKQGKVQPIKQIIEGIKDRIKSQLINRIVE